MKIFFLTLSLLFSSLASAAPESIVFPEVYNFGSRVQVTIRNHTDRNLNCSGFIYMDSMNGRRETHYFNAYVYPRETFFRTIQSWDYYTRYTWVNHSIRCY
jgi:hypothetical protein